jgi:hypothetical protein
MTAKVVSFRARESTDARDALYAAVVELQALISIDPVLGASPVRVCFAFNPQAKAQIAACLCAPDGAKPRVATAYALVAYDFSFALHLFALAGSRIPIERAKEIICCSADLQEGLLMKAAEAFSIAADPISDFDAEALKASFFPNTQESVTHLFRLRLRSAGSGEKARPPQIHMQVGYPSSREGGSWTPA